MRPPTYDLLLAFRQLTSHLPAIRSRFVALDASLGGTTVVGIDVHYRADADLALFLFHLDHGVVTGRMLETIEDAARGAGGDLRELRSFGEADRARLYDRILPGYRIVHRELPGPLDALDVLCHSIGLTPPPNTRARAGSLRVRFRRGSEWCPGRLCRLAGDGLFIASSAPLAPGQRTEVEIAAPSVSVRLQAIATRTTSDTCVASLGSSGFSARILDDEVRNRPTTNHVLTWARGHLVAAGQLPRRRESRASLCWPARMSDTRAEREVFLRDVSPHGLFIAGAALAEGSQVRLRVPFDLAGPPVLLQGRVVRVVDRVLAEHHGVAAGAGLEVEPAAADLSRYASFVSRIAARGAHAVFVAARHDRLGHLTGQFAGVGYATTGFDDARTLLARADGDDRPEVVVIDEAFGNLDAIKLRLGRYKVPVLEVGSSPAATRRLVDAALISA